MIQQVTKVLKNEADVSAPGYVDRLTLFTFLWASQAIVHQEFIESWVVSSPILGWTLTILAWAALLWPRSLSLFIAMMAVSITFNVIKWPDVFNHILAESVIHITILLGIFSVLIPVWRANRSLSIRDRDAIFDRFAPVVGTMLIVVYYFAFIAKINTDFIMSTAISCANFLYGDLVRVFPFFPTDEWTSIPVIWGTIAIELAIPVLLTFRKTRYFAVLLGLGFHFMLGIIGHRTFSALAFALYSLYCIEPVMSLVNYSVQSIIIRRGLDTVKRYVSIGRVIAILVAIMFAVELTGNYPPPGRFSFARVDWAFWLSWSALIGLVYGSAILLSWWGKIDVPRLNSVVRPGLLWIMVSLVILNGMSQYMGLKTKTSFTMYSNLRTEGGYNTHLFMPVWRVADYQNDLVEIIETDHPELQEYIDLDQYITHFEFRRLVSTETDDFRVAYRRGETSHNFELRDSVSTDAELSQKHPVWLAKLLYFRPVSKGEEMLCLH